MEKTLKNPNAGFSFVDVGIMTESRQYWCSFSLFSSPSMLESIFTVPTLEIECKAFLSPYNSHIRSSTTSLIINVVLHVKQRET